MNECPESSSNGPASGWHRWPARALCHRRAARWLLFGGLAAPLGLLAVFLHLRSLSHPNALELKGVIVAVLVAAIVCLVVGISLVLRGLFGSRAKDPPETRGKPF